MRPGRCLAAVAVAAAVLAGCSGGGPTAELATGTSSVPETTVTLPVATTSTTSPPPPVGRSIEELMDGAGMTALGRRLFVGARPELQDAARLATDCGIDAPSEPGDTHTFGCVVRGRIHVRSFGAPELHGLTYAVAAHELLHVVYLQLPVSERTRIDSELTAARTGNDVLEDRLSIYAESGDDTLDEVHSVLGAEFAGLSPALEAHYGRYFDRTKVLVAYQDTLGHRDDELREIKARADDLGRQLEALRDEMDSLEAAGDVRAFNARVATYNSILREHNAAAARFNAALAEYRRLLAA
ncbi:MAG TPA: hypothetical protein VF045_09255 [Acidimicrobiales bacterium]